MKYAKFASLLALLALAASCGATRYGIPRGSRQWGNNAAADRFGVAGGLAGRQASDLLAELGVGWVRMPVSWAEVEPRPGNFRSEQVEAAVRSHLRSQPGIQVMVTLRARSPWAGGRRLAGVPQKTTVPPRDLQQYYSFVYNMALRGKGVVKCWQIENEMEGREWWAGSPEQYLQLLRTAYRAIHAADPKALVALGGFTSEMTTVATFLARGESKKEIARHMGYTGPLPSPKAEAAIRRNVEFIETVIAGAKDYCDVVDIHLYNEYDTIPARVEWFRSEMRKSGYTKPIWATEVGGPDSLVKPYSDEAQAQEVVKRTALCLASGVDKVFWLNLMESESGGSGRFGRLGLVTREGQRKQAYGAYLLTIQKLGDLPYKGSLDIPGGYGFRFGRNSREVWVLWADQGGRALLQTKAPTLRATYLSGQTEALPVKNGAVELPLQASPVFVEEVSG